MKIALITLFPNMFEAISDYGISGRAVKNGLVELACFNPRDFTEDKHRTVDDRPYGGGPGMVMLVEPLRKAIDAAREWIEGQPIVVYLSPQGMVLNQSAVNKFAEQKSLILIAGRYEGIDERFISLEVDEEWSIGDYVLSGGELAAMVLIDSVCRLLPGVLGHDDSAHEDSFVDGLLDYPHYTRPERINDFEVPEVLLSGNHEEIRCWRLKQALGKTWRVRPDLFESIALDDEQQRLLQEFIDESD